MDLVICEAPLDSSFQKEKLVLVNKGSLGRRRKPSRANLKLLLSPSTDTFPSTQAKKISQPTQRNNVTKSAPTTPVYVEQKIIVNKKRDNYSSRFSNKGLKIESSLPRTLPEPNQYVNDAQQFTIEAKLKRRKTDTGRSSVLIQTWERRTVCDSFSRPTKPKTIERTNRFQNKENMGGATIIHDSHSTYPNHNSCTKKDRWSKDGEFVASVRDSYNNGTMVYQSAVNEFNHHRKVNTQPHGHQRISVEKEPEWVSLSRKLRAKFVEGHIGDQDSTDSYSHEEPEGVDLVVPKRSSVLPRINNTTTKEPKQTTVQHPQPKPEKKIRVVVDTSETSNENGEPPWIQLSRKLCTKFIEEHIEYPIVSGDVPVQIPPEVLECNGDVRIVEKIGKKEKKSKSRKDSEPEWVSLSKKLRAKFIESHIDDPETMSLENQLNASDPEETSSESLSSSPESTPLKKYQIEPKNYEYIRSDPTKASDPNKNTGKNVTHTQCNGLSFEEKECCWEYQEMEFDQESSGAFQEQESLEYDSISNIRNDTQQLKSYNRLISQSNSSQFISDVQVCPNSMSFAETVNTEPFHNAECYNNDVLFAPAYTNNSTTFANLNYQNGYDSDKKHITVQIVSHPSIKISDESKREGSPDWSPVGSPPTNNGTDFFNISTWEEAHYVSDDQECENKQKPCQETGLVKSFKSKSMDNICDDVEENLFERSSPTRIKEKCKKGKIGTSLVNLNSMSKSETVLDQIDAYTPSENNLSSFKENNHVHIKNYSKNSISKDATNANSFQKPQGTDKVSNGLSKNNTEKPENACKQDATKKQPMCNGFIPNSIAISEKNIINGSNNVYPPKSQANVCNINCNGSVMQRNNMNGNNCINEYANINPLATGNNATVKEYRNTHEKSECVPLSIPNREVRNSSNDCSPINSYALVKKSSTDRNQSNSNNTSRNMNIINDKQKTEDASKNSTNLKMKSRSLCDISKQKEYASSPEENSETQNQRNHSQNSQDSNSKEALRFQHFSSEADIPLCAKLIKQNGKMSTSSISSSSIRNGSPCSESSHVYEDMFKETTSCPSDSETSSWTVIKSNSYYINGRSSSMNDLDYSDSCSMSVKCDYASSCSEHSTLQSRHSSCTSSSFYVNLRDYDSHMLEPSLNRRKERNKKISNGNSSKLSSNPPTPESLRHLFTSPFNSIPNRGNRLMNKITSEPEIHYYSTAAVTSTAFKHGFDPTPPKPKKTERSSSIKIKDIAHGIILTFKKFQNHSKSSHVSSTHYVDVSHLAENGIKPHSKPKKEKSGKQDRKGFWGNRTDSDSGCPLSASEIQRAKARRASSDLTGLKPKLAVLNQNPLFVDDEAPSEKKKAKNGKKSSSARDKARKNRSKSVEPKAIPTVSRKVQQLADGTFYLVTTVSGDTALPGVYSDSPDTSSELSTHKPVKPSGESNC